jgi:Domain of unknown function (DUF5103)
MKNIFLVFLGSFWQIAISQTMPEPGSLTDTFCSGQAYPTGNPLSYPFFELGTTDGLHFCFDELSTDQKDLRFIPLLCTYDWQLDEIETSNYIQGFSELQITNVQHSFNTLVEYTHYQFEFPNDMMKLRLSGNYCIVIFEGDDWQDRSSWRFVFRMLAYEQLVNVASQVHPSSVVSDRFKSQEVDFTLQHPDYSIFDYQNDLHVCIYQNMNWSTYKYELKPVFIKSNELVYDLNLGENAFSGGSEYRNFEFKSLQYQSSAIDYFSRKEDGYHLYLKKDLATGNRTTSSGIDLNGHFFIRNDEASDSDIEAEYVNLHFQIEMPEMSESTVYVDGGYFRMLKQPIALQYDAASKSYKGSCLVKQCFADYRYIVQDQYSSLIDASTTEGNSSQTENIYHLVVYNRDRTTGHDRLVALHADNSVK